LMSHSTEYPVTYNATTHLESLVYGHGFAFNGKYAYPIPCASGTYIYTCPWAKNNTNWEGSNTCMSTCFHTYKFNGSKVNRADAIGNALYNEFGPTAFKAYLSHEENRVTNWTATSISSVFVNDSVNLIASYSHRYQKGLVVSMSVFGDDIIATDPSTQYFVLSGLVLGKTGLTQTGHSSVSTSTISTQAPSSSTMSASTTTAPDGPPVVTTPNDLPSVNVTILGMVGVAVTVLLVVGLLLRRKG